MIVFGSQNTRWVIEMDYDADPETPEDKVKADLADELTTADAPVVGEKTLVLALADAFRVRMRFAENVRSIERAA
jgi:hypothetical protein